MISAFTVGLLSILLGLSPAASGGSRAPNDAGISALVSQSPVLATPNLGRDETLGMGGSGCPSDDMDDDPDDDHPGEGLGIEGEGLPANSCFLHLPPPQLFQAQALYCAAPPTFGTPASPKVLRIRIFKKSR